MVKRLLALALLVSSCAGPQATVKPLGPGIYRAIADGIGSYENQELAVLKAANDYCGYGRRVSANSIGTTLDFACLKPGEDERQGPFPPPGPTIGVPPF
jgi:hypothetical protein